MPAARPLYEADRHAKKELKKRVRGVRPIERAAEATGHSVFCRAPRPRDAAVFVLITDQPVEALAYCGGVLALVRRAVAAGLERQESQAGLGHVEVETRVFANMPLLALPGRG